MIYQPAEAVVSHAFSLFKPGGDCFCWKSPLAISVFAGGRTTQTEPEEKKTLPVCRKSYINRRVHATVGELTSVLSITFYEQQCKRKGEQRRT